MSARTTVGARTTTTTTTTTTTAGNHQHHHGESNSSTPDSIHHDDNNTDISNTDTETDTGNGNGNGSGNPPVPPPRRKQHQHQHQHRQIPSKRIQRRDSSVHLPRLIRRDYAYDQSSNRVRIANLHHSKTRLVSLLCKDWFHVLLRIKWYYTIGFVMIVWYAMIWVFAFVYMGIDGSNFNRSKDCGLGEPGSPISFPTAYAFSLETCTTVGYGLPGSANGFFNSDCEGLQIAITLQMIWSMLSNAFLVSFFFSQMSKCDKRSIQLVFSKKLCVNVVRVDDGEEEEEEGSNSSNSNSNSNSNNHKHNHNGNMVCINVRCYDLDSAHPLVECHARIYLLDHRMKFHPLRLLEPNDDLGGVLYPSAPTTIVHNIDHHSALSPPRSRSPYVATAPTGLALRAIDSVTCNREEVICPVCGEGYGTHERLAKHIAFQKIVEEKDDYPIEGTHRGLELPSSTTTTTTTTSPNNYTITLADVQRHIETTLSEIVVVVEAIDPQLSGTFQAVQSYRLDDIEFGADFAPCMSADPGKDRFVVDLRKFHGVVYHDDMYNGGCCGGEDNNNNNNNSDDDDSLMSFAPPDTTANDTNNNNNNNNNIHGEPLGVRGVASECSV